MGTMKQNNNKKESWGNGKLLYFLCSGWETNLLETLSGYFTDQGNSLENNKMVGKKEGAAFLSVPSFSQEPLQNLCLRHQVLRDVTLLGFTSKEAASLGAC